MSAVPDDQAFRRYASAVQLAVRQVADRFRRAPASFLYESDLQGLLLAPLFDELAGSSLSWGFGGRSRPASR